MIWTHHYSLLVSAAMSIVIWATRSDFEDWHLLPSFTLWGVGHTIIITFGRRQMSSKMAELKEDLKMDKMRREHEYKMRYSWTDRHPGAQCY